MSDWVLFLWGGNCCPIEECGMSCSMFGVGYLFIVVVVGVLVFIGAKLGTTCFFGGD